MTYNQWLSIQFEGQEVNTLKSNPASAYKIILKKIPVRATDYYDALKQNALRIAECFPQPYDVLLSGGIDSEVVVRLNKDLGIKQNIYTFRFEDNINIKDVESSKVICNDLGVKLNIIDFNLKKFFETEAESYYKETYASRVELLPRLSWHSKFDNLLIFSDGEPYYKRTLKKDYSIKSTWLQEFYEYEFIHNLYGCAKGKDVIAWYNFTPEMYLTFHKLPVIESLINDQLTGKLSSWSSRTEIHKKLWPSIRDKVKLVGYETYAPPGTMPTFMQEFKDTVMKDVIETSHCFTPNQLESLLL